MIAKTRIIDALGERELLLPDLLERALAANERAKYRFALLQAAALQAGDPSPSPADLRSERLACGLEDEGLDRVVAASRRLPDGSIEIPGAGAILAGALGDVEEMLAPLRAAGVARGEPAALAARLAALAEHAAPPHPDRVPPAWVGEITHADRSRGDSLHLLVMDLHRALNRLQSGLAQESLDGARVYGLEAGDRALVAAFMRGLNATAPLKFDHPGLGTTATRSGDALVIQNDIGTTDAHVLVVKVTGLESTVTYTDVHLRRVEFFQSLFEGEGVEWSAVRSREAPGLEESERFHLCLGRHAAPTRADLERHLERVGSRVVFLIDWNRARKRLRRFVRSRDAVEILRWAAREGYGHRAFLEYGAEQLVYEAMESATATPLRPGERMDRVLGRAAAIEFLQGVLRTTAEARLAGRSARLVRDELKAGLLERFHTAEQSFFAILGDHAALGFALAGAVREGLQAAADGEGAPALARIARRARHWEHRADDLVVEVRERLQHARERGWYEDLVHEVDDVADQLEEAAFLLPLLPEVATPRELYTPLLALADLVGTGVRRLVSAVTVASHLERGGPRESLRDFLEAVEAMAETERRTDDAERELTVVLIRAGAEHRQLHLLSLVGRRLEKTADALGRCGLMLREHVMGEVTGR